MAWMEQLQSTKMPPGNFGVGDEEVACRTSGCGGLMRARSAPSPFCSRLSVRGVESAREATHEFQLRFLLCGIDY